MSKGQLWELGQQGLRLARDCEVCLVEAKAEYFLEETWACPGACPDAWMWTASRIEGYAHALVEFGFDMLAWDLALLASLARRLAVDGEGPSVVIV